MLQANDTQENQSIVVFTRRTNPYKSNKNTHKMLQNHKNKQENQNVVEFKYF